MKDTLKADDADQRPARGGDRHVGALVFLALSLLLLGADAVRQIGIVAQAVTFPFQLDFGEGVVWQQAEMILRGDGYAPLAQEPFIVFHYPPVFHLVARVGALAAGDLLAGGRLASSISALISAVLFVALVRRITAGRPGEAPGMLRWGIIAAVTLLVFLHPAVAGWMYLMRVDMVALALSMFGAWLGLSAPERPGAIWWAALCFTLSLYTKQTFIALPAATFGVLLVAAPRLGLLGIGRTALSGLAAMAFLQVATGGEFLTHVVSYNINRFVPGNIFLAVSVAFFAPCLVGLGVAGAAIGLSRLRRHLRGGGWPELRARLSRDPAERTEAFAVLWVVVCTLLLPLSLKNGANVNYFIEWIVGLGLLAAPLLIRVAQRPSRLGFMIGSLALLSNTLVIGLPLNKLATLNATGELSHLAELISKAGKPVLSDEMVMVRRAGNDVVWESAIHAELAALGRWDPAPFAARIRSAEFALIVTEGTRGTRPFDDRYPQQIADAIDAAYPLKRRYDRYTAHFPATADPEAGVQR